MLYRALLIERLSFEEAIPNPRTHLATRYPEPFWSYASLFEIAPILIQMCMKFLIRRFSNNHT